MEDDQGRMGLSLREAGAEVLAVSQFTLLADFAKGNRPSFHKAARADAARPLFELFVRELEREIGRSVPTGFFGEDMEVRLSNDGPVTVVLY
jgi:D-tyrosyl-tRNA(Tyr) deacylase